ncbi:MAG: bifunctional nicotinamidase/pyrazinamidase [Bacteroidota bacterium]|nr:bifunctional nicotinamidase/pyrazinamidase [Bacteroidota bacterium]
MKALLVIDVQNDFLPGGKLEIKGGNQIISKINDIMNSYNLIVATKDWHPENHISFSSNHEGKNVGDIIKHNGINQILWPDHCIQETFGSKFPKELNHNKINKIIYKGTNKDIDSYSGFNDNAKDASTELSIFLKDKGVDKLDCVGLATEYCVKHTALDAVKEGFNTRVIMSCTKGLSNNDIKDAINEMRLNGIVII